LTGADYLGRLSAFQLFDLAISQVEIFLGWGFDQKQLFGFVFQVVLRSQFRIGFFRITHLGQICNIAVKLLSKQHEAGAPYQRTPATINMCLS
jgi:hypothetical protein